ncbi:hypothetical protein ACFWF7_09290 [Nocardia sp. NPDC060256]|uniref:hypothetical protein n=1 Tax=unclassified Nocardia TaxID=2637762 RepID=UPI003651C243
MTTTAPSYLSTVMTPGPQLLRLSLRLDAVVTGVNGLAYLALAEPLLGLDTAIGMPIGLFLTLYGVAVAIIGTRQTISTGATRVVIAGNAAWVVISLAALVEGALELNLVGSVWAVMQAVTVGGFAALQYLGLRKAR